MATRISGLQVDILTWDSQSRDQWRHRRGASESVNWCTVGKFELRSIPSLLLGAGKVREGSTHRASTLTSPFSARTRQCQSVGVDGGETARVKAKSLKTRRE